VQAVLAAQELRFMSAHTLWELQQKKSLPLDAKILMTKRRLKQWHIQYNGNVYLAFSGGKDSTVLKDILQDIFPDVPAVFCNTGLEYPEVKKFAMSQNNVKVITPKMMFKEVISRYGYPVISKEQSSYIADIRNTKSEYIRNLRLNGNKTKSYKLSEKWKFMLNAPFKISDKCCKIMKKEPFIRYERETGSKGIIATMTDESSLRLNTWLRFGCNAFNAKRPLSRPMSFWTEQDVLQYIVEHNLKIASVYGEIKQKENGEYYTTGVKRTGCMFCMYGVQNETPNRFQIMQRTHPKQYEFCMNTLGLKDVMSYMNIPFKEEQTTLECFK
jgi:3'-phosphoadenosine 5'-phosphosulfate sulfotransferase (PAPS reductase)/FAD synthetase